MTKTFRIAISKVAAVVLIGLFLVVCVSAQPTITAVVNGASFQPSGLTSNTWITIFGTNLSSTTRTWNGSDFVNGALPTYLDNTQVLVSLCSTTNSTCGLPLQSNGRQAYIEYISPTQINIMIPENVFVWNGVPQIPLGGPVIQFMVYTAQGDSNLFFAPIQSVASAFFTVAGTYVAARHSDGVLVGQTDLIPGVLSRPAKPGEIISLYGTGFGPTTPQLPDYLLVTSAAPLTSCPVIQSLMAYCPVSVTFAQPGTNGVTTEETAFEEYAGLVESGLYQINVTIPSLPDGDTSIAAIVYSNLSCGGGLCYDTTQTQAGVMITIQQ
jgi:uncharacterized protein (TIGR03437 family)